MSLFTRDLNRLKTEISTYTDEANIWKVAPGISNSAGNLTLHLIGNLNHFIGATLGATGYVRKRDEEFSSKGIARAVLLADLDNTIAMMQAVLSRQSNDDLDKEFPLELNGKKYMAGEFMIHLYGHLGYHLGQINYHRRLLDK